MKFHHNRYTGSAMLSVIFMAFGVVGASAQDFCRGYGPQSPRDISQNAGANGQLFTPAPPSESMNLCNIHSHTNAEHKGPGFEVFAGKGPHGGYQCTETPNLTASELKNPNTGHGGYAGIKPGDTIEVHWVYSSCKVTPGEGLGSCLSDSCANPELRVETQVFLVVNDPDALNFNDFAYAGNTVDGRPQPLTLPADTGTPIVYAGSTTGSKYSQAQCSPLQVTWSVRPNCAKIDIASLNAWADAGNVFKEDHSHEVRGLVTNPDLLAPIE
ncbi:MAG: delta-class carbonic anhydrase [Paracoccaceae bacterium]